MCKYCRRPSLVVKALNSAVSGCGSQCDLGPLCWIHKQRFSHISFIIINFHLGQQKIAQTILKSRSHTVKTPWALIKPVFHQTTCWHDSAHKAYIGCIQFNVHPLSWSQPAVVTPTHYINSHQSSILQLHHQEANTKNITTILTELSCKESCRLKSFLCRKRSLLINFTLFTLLCTVRALSYLNSKIFLFYFILSSTVVSMHMCIDFFKIVFFLPTKSV